MTEWVGEPDYYWIGLSDRHSEGTFVWESGRPLSTEIANKWGWGQPDDWKNGQDCAFLDANTKLDDSMCGEKLWFVCQKRTSWSELWTELYAYVEELV